MPQHPLDRDSRAYDGPIVPSPAEARSFSILEMLVLVVGFALAASVISHADRWDRAGPGLLAFGLLASAAAGLGFSGPILVSWRERLGRRRPVWGLGESLWFATGILVQIGVLTGLAYTWLERLNAAVAPAAALVPIVLIFLLPAVYLTGNPKIEFRRAPGSWSNVVGLLSVGLWCVLILFGPRLTN